MMNVSLNSTQQNQPSFQARFSKVPYEIKNNLQNEVTSFYRECTPSAKDEHFGNKPFDFGKLFENFKTRLQIATTRTEGEISIVHNKGEAYPRLVVTDKNNFSHDTINGKPVIVTVTDILHPTLKITKALESLGKIK